jgi:hypothetical protein
VGDGLTQMRVRSFYESINTSSINFRQQYKESSTFAKALDRLVLVVGDLHGGGFHFLGAIYSLFYGAFMQPMQFAMGWKRIKGSDVTKTYQQSASLALLLLGEAERGLYFAFLHDMFVSEGEDFFEEFSESSEDCGEYLARQFPLWLQQKLTTSTDEVLRMNILYVTITRKYALFRQSSRNGDSTTVEWLYEYFIPIWLMVGKHNYVEIGLSQMEDLYSRVPFHVLQAIRENRFLPLHKGKTRNGQHMSNWALDQVMELLQIKYKDMNFPKTQTGWQEHSTNMPLVARSKKYAETEYSRRFDVDSYDEQYLEFDAAGVKQDKGNCKTQTTIPRRTNEKIMLSEILFLSNTFVETPGRKMTEETYWKELKNVTTKLEEEETPDNATVKDGRSATEQVAVDVNHELMENTPHADETPLEIQDTTEMDQLEWHQTLEDDDDEFADEIAVPVLTDENEVDDEGDNANESTNTRTSQRSAIVLADNETVIQVGKAQKKKMTVRKAKLNSLALSDIIASGQKKMVELDIPAIRHRRKSRQQRQLKALQLELDSYLADETGSSKLNWILETLDRDSMASASDLRLEYRLMCKGCWITPAGDPDVYE